MSIHSSECWHFDPGVFDLAREWFGKFEALFLNGGSLISGTCKFLASEWEKIPAAELDSRVLLSGGVTHQHKCELGTLRGKNLYSRVRPLSGGNLSSRVWDLVGLRVGEIPERRGDVHKSMPWCNLN